MKSQIFKISFLPDLSMPKYATRYGQSCCEKAGNVMADILGLMDHRSDDRVLLRYLYNPTAKSLQERLNIFFQIHASDMTPSEKMSFLGKHLLSEFYVFEESSHKEAMKGINLKQSNLFVVRRAEEVIYEPEKENFYYAPLPTDDNLSNVMDRVCIDSMLHSFASPCVLDITVKPTELTPEESHSLLIQMKELERQSSSFDPERQTFGSIDNIAKQRDILSSRFRDHYQKCMDTYYSGRVFEFSIKVLSHDKREGLLLARAISEAFAPNGNANICEKNPISSETGRSIVDCEHCLDSAMTSDNLCCYSEKLISAETKIPNIPPRQYGRAVSLSRMICLSDMINITRLLALPTSEGKYYHTIRIESEIRRGVDTENTCPQIIRIGDELERPGTMEIGTEQMQKHLFVAGVTGSGKTTTILSILSQLWEKHQIPFLVIEPVKSEYRTMINSKSRLSKDLRIYSPGNERVSPFRFNPMQVPSGVTVEEHISAIEACFAGAIPMSGGPLPSLISEAVVDCYENKGFSLCDLNTKNNSWPTIKSLVSSAKKIMSNRGYVGEIKSNLQTAIDVRLSSLCQRSIGRMFASENSFPSIDELLKWPTILEMDSLNLDQQNLLALFLLTSIREHLGRKGPTRKLCHIIVLEEAHNLIGVQHAQGRVSEDFADPRGHAARFLVKMLAEIRAYGEGIIVVDQSPASIAPEVLKNTAIKIVHRTVSEDDRDALASAMLMDKYAHEELARLDVGQAFVYHERLYRPSLVKCCNLMYSSTRPEDVVLLDKISDCDWFVHGQQERLLLVKAKLDDIMQNLASDLAVKVNDLKRNKTINGWRAFVEPRSFKVQQEINETLSHAMLDSHIRDIVLELRECYSNRFNHLIKMATSKLGEIIHDSKK